MEQKAGQPTVVKGIPGWQVEGTPRLASRLGVGWSVLGLVAFVANYFYKLGDFAVEFAVWMVVSVSLSIWQAVLRRPTQG